jgi:hypothetical protein
MHRLSSWATERSSLYHLNGALRLGPLALIKWFPEGRS